jgi:hypothetical protein
MEGENYVKLVGKIIRPDFKTVGDYNSSLFKATLAIPVPDSKAYQYIKVSSFKCADALGDLPANTFISAQGHIEERSYDGKCRHCGGFDKKYWTEVVIDNFIKL